VDQPALDDGALVDFDALVMHVPLDAGACLEFEGFGRMHRAVDRSIHDDVRRLRLAIDARALESENARLREEVAIFESMLSADGRNAIPLSIRRFKVEPQAQRGEYRFGLLLLASGLRRGEFRGRYELLVRLTEEGRSAMITLPETAESAAPGFGLDFKHFQRVEGTFRVAPAARVESVQVRIYEAGSVQVRATETAQPG